MSIFKSLKNKKQLHVSQSSRRIKLEPGQSIWRSSPQLYSVVALNVPPSSELREGATKSRQKYICYKAAQIKECSRIRHISNFTGYEGMNTN